jgi:hypothetical protein
MAIYQSFGNWPHAKRMEREKGVDQGQGIQRITAMRKYFGYQILSYY